jgi:hypothetical protein
MTKTAKIREELMRDPSIRNRDLMARYGCTNSLISHIRARMELPYFAQKRDNFRVYLPAHMLQPLAEIARDMGETVTIDDVVVSVVTDLIAECQTREAAE